MGKKIWILVIITFILGVPSFDASAASKLPKLTVDCFVSKNLGSDFRGEYVEYDPSVGANFNGKNALIKVYVNNRQTSTIKITRSSSSYFVLTKITAPIKFYKDEIIYGKNSFKYVLQDSKSNRHTWTCETYLSESSFGSVTPGANSGIWSSGLSGCTFKGKKLYGSVYFTNSSYSADFSVYVTNSSYSADLNVYLTSSSY